MNRILILLLFLFSNGVIAQNFLSWQFKDRYFSASVGTGTSTYFGELNYNDRINDRLSQINFGIEARLLSKLGARLEATYFTLNGADNQAPDNTFERQRNLSFNSRNFQIQLHGIYYFKKYKGDFHKRWSAEPYVFTGAGYMFYNPTAELGGETFSLREAQTEGVAYDNWALNVPAGVGLKFRVNEFTNLNFEVSYNYTLTDRLDDVSENYATEFVNETAELLSDRKDEIGVVDQTFYDQIIPGAARGDSSTKDSFLLISLKIELFIPPELFSGKSSPVLRKPAY